MSINMIALIIYCAIGVMVIMLAICFNLIRMVKELEKKVKCISNDNEQHYKAELQLQSYFNSIDTSMNKLRGSLEVLTTGTDGKLNDIQRQLSSISTEINKIQCSVAINGHRLNDIIDWTGMLDCLNHEVKAKDHNDASDIDYYLGDKIILTENVKPNIKEKDDEQTSVCYRWIFPSDDKSVSEKSECPVIGQWYFVVGTIKDLDETQLIFSDDCFFNGTDFVTRNNQRFEKVLAYIKRPSSSDIMHEIFSLGIKTKG